MLGGFMSLDIAQGATLTLQAQIMPAGGRKPQLFKGAGAVRWVAGGVQCSAVPRMQLAGRRSLW